MWTDLAAIDERFYGRNPKAARQMAASERRDARVRAWLAERGIREPRSRVAIPLWRRVRVLARCGERCVYCGRSATEYQMHIDHIHPLSRGGTNDEWNLATACRDCNLGKGAGLLDAGVLAELFSWRLPEGGWREGSR